MSVRPTVPEPVRLDLPEPSPLGEDVGGAFSALFDLYAGRLYRYCAARAGTAAAEDLVSETFLRALHARATFDPARGSAQAWLFGIATNLLRNHRRGELRHLAGVARSAGQDRAILVTGDRAEERVDAAAELRRLVPALLALPPVDRDILLLSAWASLGPSEIAVALSLPAGTVRSRLHRLRRHLCATAAQPPVPTTATAVSHGSAP